MSGEQVPYQLRPNKFVERQLFLDVLDFVRVWNGPSKYMYISMGARFLEDFKLINYRFAIDKMMSIEADATTCTRQQFNRLGFIECQHWKSSELIESLDRLLSENNDRRIIAWLDYVAANERGEQLAEFRQLISKLTTGDVAKITLNANSQSFRRRATQLTRKDFDAYLKKADSEKYKDYETYLQSLVGTPVDGASEPDRSLTLSDDEHEIICIGNLLDQLGEYAPIDGIKPGDLSTEEFAAVLLEAVKIAALKGIEGSKRLIKPLAAFRYRDGEHQMLTVTVIVADDALAKQIDDDKIFGGWALRSTDWSSVHEVAIPDTSAKERHHITGLMSQNENAATIHAQLPFRFDKSDAKSLTLLEAFLLHYRRYPSFAPIH